jgi:transglutaminase-like putative cysteine protease
VATTDGALGARNPDYAQALALAGLLVGASLSLSRLYASNGWVLATWLTIGSALGLAALLRRMGVGQLLSLLAMLAGFVVVAGILLFSDTVLLVIPTRATLVDMLQATGVALRGMSEQAAPVAVTREFLLLTCAGVWAVTTAADGLAFRARQPLLALVPALGLFVFPAVVRAGSPAWYTAWFLMGAAGLLLFEGRARLATWGRWVSSARSRPAIGWRLPLSPAASTGRWLALVAALLGLAVPWLLPGYGQAPLLDLKEGPGSDSGVALNPFVSLRTRLRSQQDVPVFRVKSTQGEYWRLLVYDRFNGTAFVTSGDPRQNLVGFRGQTAGELAADVPTGQVTQEFEIQQLDSLWLPAASAPVQVRAEGRRVLSNETFRNLTVRQRLRPGFTYQVVSQVPTIRSEQLVGPVDYGQYPEMERYRDPGNLDPDVKATADEVVKGKAEPFAKALAIQDYLRNEDLFTYNLNVPDLASGGNQLRRFLLDVREGYCEQFAIAMAVMARLEGIPSRVAVGFTSGKPVDDYLQVTTHDAHAWPELWFPRAGWVRFEPTPRGDGQVSLPLYTTASGRTATPAAPTGTTVAPSGTTTPSNRALAPEPETSPTDPALGGRQGRGGILRRPAVQVAIALALLLALVPTAKWTRDRLARRRAGRRPRDAVAESYTEVTRWAGDAGIGRRRAETPAAYARRMRADYADDAVPLVELTGLYELAEYGAAEPPGEQALRAGRLARAARTRLAGRIGWRRRLGAALSPRSLLAPRRPRTADLGSGAQRRPSNGRAMASVGARDVGPTVDERGEGR